ncbi:unnamed protein product, partial [Candidula unifasciata]
MESSLRYLVLLTAISGAMALTPEACRNASEHCQIEFTQAVQQSNQVSTVCSSARRSLTCVEELRCDSEMYLRTAIRIATKRLTEKNVQSCELGTRFPKDREYSRECQLKRETCLNAYIDMVIMLCQDLNDFIACEIKQDSCELNREEVQKFVTEEKLRLTLPSC